ncbi:helix-turn-helix transcriptional regulator [Brucella tritici]|uniref:Helix-turn-helix transcriptional regulator n=1 Tax=Brucella tritici TaxID=94626 RepID=A0A7V8B1J3_9HYPH|nr:helix-turn-helix transcriptional regulator [Brucella tritici]KAB2655920.1 helix-turn-helix transcriptional regulator [Brucella tritici]
MMSYQLKIDLRKRQAGRLISKTHREIQKAFVRASREDGLTQQKLAKKLGLDRSVVNRILVGEGNLTLRTISDLAWALGFLPVVEFRKDIPKVNSNHFNCPDDDFHVKEVKLTRPDRERGKIDVRAEAKAVVELDEYA